MLNQKLVSIERLLKSQSLEYKFKWNQPCLSCVSNLRCSSNSLNSALELIVNPEETALVWGFNINPSWLIFQEFFPEIKISAIIGKFMHKFWLISTLLKEWSLNFNGYICALFLLCFYHLCLYFWFPVNSDVDITCLF